MATTRGEKGEIVAEINGTFKAVFGDTNLVLDELP